MTEVSEKLVAQFQALEGQDIQEKIEEIEERIWLAHKANRRAVAIGNDRESRETGITLQKALDEKRSLKFQVSHQRDENNGQLERVNTPVINHAYFLIDQEIARLNALRILRAVDRKTVYGEYRDKIIRTVETNRAAVAKIQALLLDAKNKIRSIQHSPISEILSTVEDLEAKVNQIHLKQVEKVEMGETEYPDP